MRHYKREFKVDSRVDAEIDDYLNKEAAAQGITKSLLIFQILKEKASGTAVIEGQLLKTEIMEEVDAKFSLLKSELEKYIEDMVKYIEDRIKHDIDVLSDIVLKESTTDYITTDYITTD